MMREPLFWIAQAALAYGTSLENLWRELSPSDQRIAAPITLILIVVVAGGGLLWAWRSIR